MDSNSKPKYQPWNEEEFQADVFVRGMTWLQRHLYRALLQASFFHGTRPYLPNDDDVLWVLSGAESLEMWQENKARILKRFSPAEHDSNLLENKRVTADWERITDKREVMSEIGKKGAAARNTFAVRSAGANRVLTASLPSEVKTERSEEKISEVEISENAFLPSTVSISQEQSTGDWKSLAIRHKRIFGKKAATQFRIKYADACLKYGETIVLECFDSWAPSALDWVRREGVDQPLFSFFKKLPQEAEEAVELAEALKEDDQRLAQKQQAAVDREKQAAAVQAESIERQTQEIIALRDARPQVSEVSMEDFLEAK